MIVYPITLDCVVVEVHIPLTKIARETLDKIITQLMKENIAEIRIKNITKIVEG